MTFGTYDHWKATEPPDESETVPASWQLPGESRADAIANIETELWEVLLEDLSRYDQDILTRAKAVVRHRRERRRG